MLDTPIARLQKMNPKAIKLYADHDIDLTTEYLEIAVCAQHNNGGIAVDADWQTSVAGLYCAGEAAGTFGICRPGGTALNSTQVGSFRAAQHIAGKYLAGKSEQEKADEAPASQSIFAALHTTAAPKVRMMTEEVYYQSETVLQLTAALLDKTDGLPVSALLSIRDEFAAEMSRSGAFLRHAGELELLYKHRHLQLAGFFSVHRAKDFRALKELFIDYDILLTQYVYTGAMLDYIRHGGISRGSAVYTQDTVDVLLAAQQPQVIDTAHAAYVQETRFERMTGEVTSEFVPVRPIPDAELWFETVYNRGKR